MQIHQNEKIYFNFLIGKRYTVASDFALNLI